MNIGEYIGKYRMWKLVLAIKLLVNLCKNTQEYTRNNQKIHGRPMKFVLCIAQTNVYLQ